MLGYITKKEAIEIGFTHHGKCFGIPCWIAPEKDFMVATKWEPMEYIITSFHFVEQFLIYFIFLDDEPVFKFHIGNKIN